MRKMTFTTIFNATTSTEAESLIGRLRDAGFHPAELGLTTTVPFLKDAPPKFPVQVPVEEAGKAKQSLRI